MRGTLVFVPYHLYRFGIIPAYAGNTSPRHGSYPITGIIPAYAGNTRIRTSAPTRNRDHPRVCGEHLRKACFRGGLTGSSPRMRGTPGGNRVLRRWYGDHPRVCGEHSSGLFHIVTPLGSSPRMRGTPDVSCAVLQIHRIIPAYAGNTVRQGAFLDAAGIIPAYAGNTTDIFRLARRLGDHPRVCGEHSGWPAAAQRNGGSSPRMRGTLVFATGILNLIGIIPAYAGNTGLCYRDIEFDWDHPRVCGEHYAIKDSMADYTGSSPRMRGTHSVICWIFDRVGIIPAYAGNTAP